MADYRRLPGSYGLHRGDDAYIQRSELQFLRQENLERSDGWMVSTADPFSSRDAAGVVMTQNLLKLYYLPDLERLMWPSQARINVAANAANSYVETRIYQLIGTEFKALPGSYAQFPTTADGLVSVNLQNCLPLTPDGHYFLAVIARGGAPTLEGFSSGMGAEPFLIRPRYKASHTATMQSSYQNSDLAFGGSSGTPFALYLSKEASNVL